MAIVLKDRVKQNASAPGTGTVTLTTTPTGFQAFSAIGNGNVTYFAIVDPVSGAWEVNYGTYTSSGTTLSRNATPLSSSNAGALVNFTGTSLDVFCTYPSEKAIYEETTGNVLIDGGPITVIGTGVTTYTTFSAALGELYANINSFAQLYAQNLNGGSEASADFVAYNDIGDGTYNFVDMGINSSNYSSATYPIFTAGSAYVFNDGGEMFIGSATDDVVLFAGGTDVTDEAVRIDKTTKAVTTSADVNVGGALDVTSAATFGSTVLLNADPTLNLQAATKQYVDTAVSTGLHLHQPVNVATTGNLTATYNNGTAGVGATLTNSGTQVALSIDGISLSVNNRVLVWQQTAAAQNGVYVVTTVGSGSTNWVLTRSSDADNYNPQSDTGLGGGDYFYVQSGTTGAGDSYVCTNDGTITFGTTAITFAQFSGAITYTGGTNIDVSGQTISLTGTVAATNGGTGTATVTTGDLLYGSAANTWSKLAAGAGYRPLVMNAGGTNVEWNALALNQSGTVSGALPATNGGTGLSSYTLGDIVYSSAANTLAALAGNTTTTKKFLTQTGTGSVSAAPAWGTISGSDVNGNISGSAGSVANALTLGSYLTGTSFNGSTAVTAAVDATSANIASKVVARDASGNFSAGTITATLSGAATSATTATNIAGGAANQIPYQTGAATTTFITAPTTGSTFLSWSGSAFAWSAISTPNAVTFNSGGTGDVSGTTFNGSAARTISYNTVGASPLAGSTSLTTTGTVTTGTWSGLFGAVSGANLTSLTAANLSGTVAVANGGTASSTAGGARTNLGATTLGSNLFTITNPSAVTFPRFNADNTVSSLDAATFRSAIGAGTSSTTGTVTSIVAGTYLTGGTITTSGTIAVDATTTNTASKIVARDASGNFSAGTITATLSGTATSAGSVTNALTLGTYLTGTSYNGSAAVTAAVDATSANTASKVVARDASGNFSAGTITATLSGNASTATTATQVSNSHSPGTYITGSAFNGSAAQTWAVDATSANTASKVVARDASGNFSAGTITATLSGNATSATTATSATSATTATTATTANALNTSNNYQVNSLGVGTAGSGTAGEIRATNNVTAYYSSDIKFKENVRNIPNAAATAAAIGGKLFDWKDSYIEEHGGEDGYFIVKADFGVIAQDAQKHFPVAVRTRPDGSLAVDYEKLSALAMAAIAEQEDRIAKLEALVAKLIEG
jgi:hypothetical protein